MAEAWLSLSRQDQAETLELAASRTGRPPHLLEKDIWVVWALAILSRSTLADKLTFKGGTSLSKVYRIIDRFSEDLDLTYDIRALVPDLLSNGNPIPSTASQAKRISDSVNARLSAWITNVVMPMYELAFAQADLKGRLIDDQVANGKLVIAYEPVKMGTGYASPTVLLEFGARSTGEPHHHRDVRCDAASALPGIDFPLAQPLVMTAERTFWEKATAAHVYSLQVKMRGHRFSRHWFDLAALADAGIADRAIADQALADQVAEHKAMYFAERDLVRSKIDYFRAVRGEIKIVPDGEALALLTSDYDAMMEDGLLPLRAPSFSDLIEKCRRIEDKINRRS